MTPHLRPARSLKNSLLLILSLTATGCSLFGSGDTKKEVPLTQAGNKYCPDIQILSDLREKSIFRPGPGRNNSDILYAGQIYEYFVGCSVRREKGAVGKLNEVPRKLAVQISPLILARRTLGKGATRTAILDYFVGVVKSNKTPVEKKIIPLSLPFEAKSVSTFSLEEPISIVIKLQPGEEISAYSIFIGFQLNKDQLLFNRERLKALRE